MDRTVRGLGATCRALRRVQLKSWGGVSIFYGERYTRHLSPAWDSRAHRGPVDGPRKCRAGDRGMVARMLLVQIYQTHCFAWVYGYDY